MTVCKPFQSAFDKTPDVPPQGLKRSAGHHFWSRANLSGMKFLNLGGGHLTKITNVELIHLCCMGLKNSA